MRIVATGEMFDLTTIENEVKVQGLTVVAAVVEQLSVIDYLLLNCSYALMRPTFNIKIIFQDHISIHIE